MSWYATPDNMISTKILFILLLIECSFCSVSEEKCSEYAQKFLYDKIPISRPGGATDLRKVPAVTGEFPHAVVLGYNKGGVTTWALCGGNLISEQFILTSAICIDAYLRAKYVVKYARLGTINLDTMDEDPNVQTYNITGRYVYPEYKRQYQYHDIGLLKLGSPVKFTKHARPACLFSSFHLPKSAEVSVVGWGRAHTTTHAISQNLNKVYLDLFTYDECKNNYKNVQPYGLLDKLMVCAGGRRVPKDTCQGDSGSALHFYSKDDNIYEIVALTSFGNVCGKTGPQGVYTRVAAYIPWIESIVWPCVNYDRTPDELDEYISSAGVPPKKPPCGKKV